MVYKILSVSRVFEDNPCIASFEMPVIPSRIVMDRDGGNSVVVGLKGQPGVDVYVLKDCEFGKARHFSLETTVPSASVSVLAHGSGQVMAGVDSGELFKFAFDEGSSVRAWLSLGAAPTQLTLDPKDHRVFVATGTGIMGYLDHQKDPAPFWEHHAQNPVCALVFDGGYLVVGAAGSLYVFDGRKFGQEPVLNFSLDSMIQCLAFYNGRGVVFDGNHHMVPFLVTDRSDSILLHRDSQVTWARFCGPEPDRLILLDYGVVKRGRDSSADFCPLFPDSLARYSDFDINHQYGVGVQLGFHRLLRWFEVRA